MERKKTIRLAIILLAVLLGISATALGATLIYRKILQETPGTVTVPDNLITPDVDTKASDTGAAAWDARADNAKQPQQIGMLLSTSSQTQSEAGAVSFADKKTPEKKEAATISLSRKQPQDNTAFRSENLFPGDSETQYYRVSVSYHDKVSVHYKAVIRQGYEKLAEVMMMRVKLLTTGEVLYDGLMRDMPQELTCKLESSKSTTDELYYEITAYLDTSVGNEYQNRYLIADFSWWVEETGNLDTPKTGDGARILLWSALAALSCGALVFLVASRKRKGEKKHG